MTQEQLERVLHLVVPPFPFHDADRASIAAVLARLEACEREVSGERANKEAARERWTACQDTLANIEQRLIALTGCEQSIEDNIDSIKARLEACEAALKPFARFAETRLRIFGTNSIHAYLTSIECSSKETARLTRADWDAAMEAVR